MSHWPPDITDVELNEDGTVTVKWQVDPILHGDTPERVDVLVNGVDYPNHSNSDVSIDKNTVQASGKAIAVEIDYVWSSPEDRQASGFILPLPAGGSVTPPTTPQRPTLSVKSRSPKTLRTRNTITVTWSSYSITNADLHWGFQGSLDRHIGLKFSAQHYGGDVSTDIPLISARMYEFKVVVKNSFENWGPYSADIVVRASSNYHSVRDFLKASGAHGRSLRSALGIQGTISLRDVLGV